MCAECLFVAHICVKSPGWVALLTGADLMLSGGGGGGETDPGHAFDVRAPSSLNASCLIGHGRRRQARVCVCSVQSSPARDVR